MRLSPLRTRTWRLIPALLSMLALGSSACEPNDGYEEPGERITVKNKFGTLVGRLIMPDDAEEDVPAVIIVPDSGAIDRNGNVLYGNLTNAYIQLSLRLAEKGVAVLRYDKAGVAFSMEAAPLREEDARFEQGAKDAALFVKELRDDARISSITLVGHGDGALLAMLAHDEEKADGVVSLAGPAYSLEVPLREELEKEITDRKLRDKALTILDELVAGKKVKEVPSELRGIFRPSVQPYLISWLKYDPATELPKVDVPTLIVHGTTDLEIAVEQANVLAEASPESELKKIKGMNHVLKLDSSDSLPAQAVRSYSDPSYKLAPDLVKVLAKFANQ